MTKSLKIVLIVLAIFCAAALVYVIADSYHVETSIEVGPAKETSEGNSAEEESQVNIFIGEPEIIE